MRYALSRVLFVAALLIGPGFVLGCGGDDTEVGQFQKAADSMMTRRDSTIARMDSAGVVQDSTRADSTRTDSTRRDTTSTKRP
jgi:hypothetical protein